MLKVSLHITILIFLFVFAGCGVNNQIDINKDNKPNIHQSQYEKDITDIYDDIDKVDSDIDDVYKEIDTIIKDL